MKRHSFVVEMSWLHKQKEQGAGVCSGVMFRLKVNRCGLIGELAHIRIVRAAGTNSTTDLQCKGHTGILITVFFMGWQSRARCINRHEDWLRWPAYSTFVSSSS